MALGRTCIVLGTGLDWKRAGRVRDGDRLLMAARRAAADPAECTPSGLYRAIAYDGFFVYMGATFAFGAGSSGGFSMILKC